MVDMTRVRRFGEERVRRPKTLDTQSSVKIQDPSSACLTDKPRQLNRTKSNGDSPLISCHVGKLPVAQVAYRSHAIHLHA
jgi:hypothetical protein